MSYSTSKARGIVYIHSTPVALCPHIEWAIQRITGVKPVFDWSDQPMAPGQQRSEWPWHSAAGTGARVASALARMGRLRFEVTEDPSTTSDGQRHMFTPRLGPFSATTGIHGDIVLGEDLLRTVAAHGNLTEILDELLGGPWDEELEAYRAMRGPAPVRYLHLVG